MRMSKDPTHHDRCGGCEKMYCRDHRLLYNECRTATYDRTPESRGLWDGGECPVCKIESRTREVLKDFERMQETLRAAING